MPVDVDILHEHAEEAAFLWRLRQVIGIRANQRLATLAGHDERIEAHLDGLRLAGASGWAVALAALLEEPDAATGFVAAVLAIAPDSPPAWHEALTALLGEQPQIAPGVTAGLTWTQERRARTLVATWHGSGSAAQRLVALGVVVACGVDADEQIRAACVAGEVSVRQAGFAAIGRLGRRDLRNLCRTALNDPDQDCRALAAWSLSLVGSDAEAALRVQAERGGPWAEDLLLLAARRLPRTAVMAWIKDHGNRPERLRRSLILAGHHGDTVVMPWILGKMAQPALARLAGAAFSLITGVDLEDAGLTAPPPAGFQVGPTDDPADDDVAMDPDEYLPWPDVPRVLAWWERQRAAFPENVRLLLGRPLEQPHLQQVLRNGTQPQRAAAALELVVSHAGRPLFDITAPVTRQVRLLASPAVD